FFVIVHLPLGVRMDRQPHTQKIGHSPALEASVSALKSALEVRTREHLPDAWTESQVSLGAALETLGRFEANIARLEEAVATYSAAVSAAARHLVLLQLATAGLRRSLDSLNACRRA
uniref:hypothetical protein n=1 Tax=uncultured Jannaschia sp. TaxID=293347 RepID=UPI00262D9495